MQPAQALLLVGAQLGVQQRARINSGQRSRIAPYLMILPALAYLAVFFVVPFISLARTSLSEKA